MPKKKFLFGTIVILSTAMVAVFSLGIYQSVMNLNDKPSAANEYIISSEIDMGTFIHEAKTNDFSGVTVKLTADIDMGGDNILPIGLSGTDFKVESYQYFSGIFDGQGHTISNLTVKITGSGSAVGWLGLFGNLRGQVLNLKLKNITLKNYNAPITDWFVGTVAGLLSYGAKVDNCIIEDCKFITEDNSGTNSRFFSTIVGGVDWNASLLTNDNTTWTQYYKAFPCISNILVDGFTLSSGYSFTAGYIIGPAYGDCDNYSGPLSVSMTTYEKTNVINIYNIVVRDVPGLDLYNSEFENAQKSATRHNVDFSAIENTTIATEDDLDKLGLEVSSAGGTAGTKWYYVNKYNDGWPMLRGFVSDWETHTFKLDYYTSSYGSLRTESDFVQQNEDGSMSVVVPTDLVKPSYSYE